jgi:hypothetical protein
MVTSLLLVAVIALVGFGLTVWMSDRLRFEERIAGGVVVGALAVSVVAFVAFEALGMGWHTVALGVAVPGCPAAVAIARQRHVLRLDARRCWRRLRLRWSHRSSLRPLALMTAASLAVSTRILSLSYQTTPNGISVGSLAVWGDWSAHLMYAGSFAYGDNRSLDLPTATGVGFRYHFLADFLGSLFTVTGATLQQSMALSAWMLAIAFPPLLWLVVMRLTRSRSTAALTVLLFTLSGGLGAWYFARDISDRGWGIVTTLPQTYARMPDQHLWVDNTISASLYAQRSTLMGLCVGFVALIVLLASRPRWSRRGFVAAGIIVGLLGIAHAHTMLTGLALASFALIADRRRTWLWFIVPTALIGLPLGWAISPQTSSIRWLLGWMAPQSNQDWPWFWFRNVGLFLPLFVGLAVLGGGLPRLRRLTTPLWLWFIVPNLIAFHPSEWNNTKYFLFWQLGGCLLIASWLPRAWSSARRSRARSCRPAAVVWTGRAALAVGFVSLISAGGLDTVRAMQRSTAIPWIDHDDLAAAMWLRTNSQPDEVLVYGADNTSAVAALGGRRAVSAYTGWTYDLGLRDWAARWSDTGAILSGSDDAASALERYGVDYVVIGPIERSQFAGDDAYWAAAGRLVFEQGEYRIYRVAR